MKKVYIIALCLLSLTLMGQKKNSYDKTVDKTSEGISTLYSDGKLGVSTLYSDLKDVAPKISKGVQELAKGLKVGAESVWLILVRQQLVWSICFLILTLSAVFNWLLFYKRTQIKYNAKEINYVTLERDIIGEIPNPKYDSYYEGRNRVESFKTILGPTGAREQYRCPEILSDNLIKNTLIQEVFRFVHLVLCLTLSYFSFIHFADMLTGFINPEFGAIKTIATIVQELK